MNFFLFLWKVSKFHKCVRHKQRETKATTDGGHGGLRTLLYWSIRNTILTHNFLTTLWFHIQTVTSLLLWRKVLNRVRLWATIPAGTRRPLTSALLTACKCVTEIGRIWRGYLWICNFITLLHYSGCQAMWAANTHILFVFQKPFCLYRYSLCRKNPDWPLCQRSIWSITNQFYFYLQNSNSVDVGNK